MLCTKNCSQIVAIALFRFNWTKISVLRVPWRLFLSQQWSEKPHESRYLQKFIYSLLSSPHIVIGGKSFMRISTLRPILSAVWQKDCTTQRHSLGTFCKKEKENKPLPPLMPQKLYRILPFVGTFCYFVSLPPLHFSFAHRVLAPLSLHQLPVRTM